MDRGRCLDILAGYGVGPRLIRLLSHFWAEAKLACRTGGYYGSVFSAGRGVTQGGPFSPRIFNVVVDAVVREWLRQSLGEEAARQGLGDLAKTFLCVFYADDGVLSARCPRRLQDSFVILVGLFVLDVPGHGGGDERGWPSQHLPVCGDSETTHLRLHSQSTHFQPMPGGSEDAWF
jgi:hypothetical protein